MYEFVKIEEMTVLREFLISTARAISGVCFVIAFVCVLGSVSPILADPSEGLQQALEADDVEAAWKAINAIPQQLSSQQKRETIKLLTKALSKQWARCTGDIRQDIADQLASLQAIEAIPELIELIRENKHIEHECAECGCCFLAWSVNDTFLELEPDFFCENRLLRALHSLATFSYAKEISELAESQTPYRPQLLVILGKIGHPRYAHFISKFADSEPLAVAHALGIIKQPSGIPVLGNLLENSSESVRWAASQSLGLIGGDRVVDTLKLRLHHPEEDVRALAARTLCVLGVTEGVSILRDLAREASVPHTRSMAIAYLGQLNDLESRPIFMAGLQDKSVLVRAYSIYALGYVGKAGDIAAIEESLVQAKTMDLGPNDNENLRLIDETAREALQQIRMRLEGQDVKP
jgi:HEAT repeat protein